MKPSPLYLTAACGLLAGTLMFTANGVAEAALLQDAAQNDRPPAPQPGIIPRSYGPVLQAPLNSPDNSPRQIEQQPADILGNPSVDGALPALPPTPGAAQGRPIEVPLGTRPDVSADPHATAISMIVDAQRQIDAGQYELAIQTASQAIALDPSGADAYKRVRADAYLRQGRYEQALADSAPLEVTVGALVAELKTGRTVLSRVPRGTSLLVDDSRGNWLKVIEAGDQRFEWAWVRKSDLRVRQRAPMAIRVRRPLSGIRIEIGPGRYPRPRYGYGRPYYDYWRNVPSPYWGYLP